ncbi:MAG: energy transducer TonB [Acidobacteriota bacterium]
MIGKSGVLKAGILIVVLLLGTSSVQGILIGSFPGLEKLIEMSDAIVVLRIGAEVNSSVPQDPAFSTRECHVFYTLKGDIPENKTIPFRLMDTMGASPSPFSIYSSHLMFLEKSESSGGSAQYQTINYRGANVRLPPKGHEKRPEGDTIADQIRFVLRRAAEYEEQKYGEKRDLLDRMIEGSSERPGQPAESPEQGGTVAQTGSEDHVYRTNDPGVELPVPVKQTMPRYTREAIQAKLEGTVVLRCIIRKTGRVTDCEIQQEVGYGLARSARREIEKNWRFRPGTLNGKPVDVWATIESRFNLGLGDWLKKLTLDEAEHRIVGSIVITGPKKAADVALGLIRTQEATFFDPQKFLADCERLKHSDRIALVGTNLVRNRTGGVTVEFKVQPK